MSLRPVFQNRDFTSKIENQRVRWDVNSLDWEAVGGCSQASLTAYGPELDLWDLIDYLRCPVMVQDEKGRNCWWGYVDEAKVRVGSIEVGVTLASMTNRVAVAYSYIEPGTQVVGQRRTTAWAEDSDARTEYGKKEWISSASGLTDAGALARRAAILAKQKWPQGVAAQSGGYGNPRSHVSGSGAENSQSATLMCKGWMDTLDWQYASWPSVVGPSYTTTSAAEQAFGNATATTKVVQLITVGTGGINVLSLSVYARKVGAPADNLEVGIFALDPATSNPTGSALASWSLAGGSMTTSLAWYLNTVTEKELAASTIYGLVLSRSGAIDAVNYYAAGVNAALGYTGGAFYIFNGTIWVPRGTDADMNFALYVNNKVDSSNQVKDLVRNFGEFLTATDVDAASGYLTSSYRDGDTTALEEVLALLEMGGPSGRRYLAEVTEERRLHLVEEPATVETYHLNKWGDLMDLMDVKVMEYLPPVGVWARLVDVIPASADVSKLADPTMQFIEGATWSSQGGLQLRFRGQPSIEEIMRIK